jgi:twitching motility protein PilT
MPRVVRSFAELSSGLLIIAGPAGSGKSTTLASILHEINRTQRRHIITLEDPVEFIHTPIKSIVTQRQVEVDTPDFATGIRQSLRQTPDVLLIGEMRDRETVLSAIKAAETGALVLTTLHTPDAVQTINRLVHMFDPSEYESVRGHLAHVLRGIIAQRLYKLESGEGRAAVVEVVSVNTTVKDYILKNDMETLYKLVDQSRLEDMQSLNGALYQLYINKQISMEEALRQSNNPISLQNKFQGIFHGTANYEFEDF